MEPKSIFIVDDDAGLRRTLSDTLRDKGYAPIAAATGKVALDRIQEEMPAVALIDLMLEDMSGLEVMKEIKKCSPGTECIVLTGYASQASAIEAVNLGAYSYVQKPYDVDQLLVTIRRATEKREAQEALQESEARFRMVTEGALVGVYIIQDHTFRYVNPALAQVFGYGTDELIDKLGPMELTHPGDRALVAEYIRRRFEGEVASMHYTFRGLRKDGTVIHCEALGRCLEYQGRPAIIGTLQDITKQKRTEATWRALNAAAAALQRAGLNKEEIYQAATEQLIALELRGAVSLLDEATDSFVMEHYFIPAGLLTALEGLTGVMGAGFRFPRARVPDYARVVERGQAVYVTDSPAQLVVKLLPESVGGVADRIVEMLGPSNAIVAPLRMEDRVRGVLHVSSDRLTEADVPAITAFADQLSAALENARLYQEEREQARQVQQIVDTVPEGVLLLDADRRILLTNPAAREYLPVLADGVRPSSGQALAHLGGRPIEELLKSPAEGLWHELHVGDLPRRTFEVAAHALEAEPEARGWVLVLRDVTQEREVRQHIQQQKRLAAVGQLAAGIAHDFNNILTTMIGFAELLEMRADMPKSAKADLARIVGQGQRAAHLIRQILDFSRKSMIQRQSLDLASFLKEAVKFLERTLPENIHIVLETVPSEVLVYADPTQIQQAVTNLAVNARDAMPNGGELRWRLSRFPLKADEQAPFPDMRPGEWIVLSVSDTGVGIPPEVLPRVFEPFFTTKGVGEGTGLGLAQVYGIVKQHEGYIDVQSREGKGTTVAIYLPSVAAEEEAREEKVPEKNPRGYGETVLLVEDEAAVLKIGKAMLKHLGYRVLTATDGEEALEVYVEHKDQIALVLSDMVMPEMGGTELYRLLRARDPAVKMVVVTGYPLGEGDALPHGIVDWINKPFSLEKLAQVVHRALKQ